MTKKEKRDHILARLDELYGTEKEGFYHNQDWQLLVAIMLSAQSTDKQMDEALPWQNGRFQTAQEVAESDIEDGNAFSGGRLWDTRRNGGHSCVPHLPPAGLGEGKESGGNGSGADEGASGGSLEPD